MVSAVSIGAGIYWGDICHARLDELQSLNHLLTGHKLPISTTLHTYIHDDISTYMFKMEALLKLFSDFKMVCYWLSIMSETTYWNV